MEIAKLIIELLSGILLSLAAVSAAYIGSNAYKDQKVYGKKELFYLPFLKEIMEIISVIQEEQKSTYNAPPLKENIKEEQKNKIKSDNENSINNNSEVPKKMKEFLDKHSSHMMIYASPRFKRTFEKYFITAESVSSSYGPLVAMSILIEESKKDLNNTESKNIDEIITNLAIYTLTNDIREQPDFIAALEKAHNIDKHNTENKQDINNIVTTEKDNT